MISESVCPGGPAGRGGSELTKGRTRIAPLAICWLLPLAAAAPGTSPAAEVPSQLRASLRAQAVATLSAGGAHPIPCLSPLLQSLSQDPSEATVAERRALLLLQNEPALAGERRFFGADGTVVRSAVDGPTGRVFPRGDEEAPETVEAVLDGISDARKLLVEQIGLPAPPPLEVVLGHLGSGIDGYLFPQTRRDGRAMAVLDATRRDGAPAVRRSAAHQFAHAVAIALGSGLSPAFGEALAAWTSLRLYGVADDRVASTLSERLDRLGTGLVVDEARLAAGNAAFFAFLDEAYGPTVVGLAFQELAAGEEAPVALDRAMRRGAGATFAEAFRDYQLWCHFVGERSDGLHFSFADRLDAPAIPLRFEGLPALSILEAPPVGALGAASVLLRPDAADGGMIVRFEGDAEGRWEADLLIFDAERRARRVPIALAEDGAGETTVPLEAITEAVLLVRNLEPEGAPRRFSWSASLDRAFPFEASTTEARPIPGGGVLVSWETLSERSLIGFSVLRRSEPAGRWVRINPLWIPPMGDGSTAVSYVFLDETAPEGASLLYRIEGVTSDGLSGFSDPFEFSEAERP